MRPSAVGPRFKNGLDWRECGDSCGDAWVFTWSTPRGLHSFSVGTTRDSRDKPVNIAYERSRPGSRDSGQESRKTVT
jgi:hypothetical protein